MKIISLFKKYAIIFEKHGYNLYMIGGTSRDYLLGIEPKDIDFTTDATPFEMSEFLEDLSMQFAKYGTVFFKDNGVKIEITTLRVEKDYKDFRHPGEIAFVKDIKKDYKRRDFTINALYIDKDFKIHDFASGLDDLNNKIIRVIGDPKTRIKEDPLRILRALRFSLVLDFEIEETLQKAIILCKNDLFLLNKDKTNFEIRQMMKFDANKTIYLLNEYGIPLTFK